MRTCRASRDSTPATCLHQALTCQGLVPAAPQAPQGIANPRQPCGDAAPQPPAPWSPGGAPHQSRALHRGGGFLRRGAEPRPGKGSEPVPWAAQRRQRRAQDGRTAHTGREEAGCAGEHATVVARSACKPGHEGKPEIHAAAAWPADNPEECCMAQARLPSADCALRDTPLGTGPGPPEGDVLLRTNAHAAEGECNPPLPAVEASEARGSSERQGHAALRSGPGPWTPEQPLADREDPTADAALALGGRLGDLLPADRGDPTADAALALGCRLGDLAVNACVHGRDASAALAALRFALAHPLSRGRA